jgi:hypothetical protein
MSTAVAKEKPDDLVIISTAMEDLDRADNAFKVPDTFFKFLAALGEAFEWSPTHSLAAIGKGINLGRKWIEICKTPGDVYKAWTALTSSEGTARKVADATRHVTWFFTHTFSGLNMLQGVGAVSYGSAGAVMGQLAPGFALVGFTANIIVNLIDLHKEEQKLANTDNEADRAKIQAKMNEKIADIVKDLLVWMGLFATTFLVWKFQKSHHISRGTGTGLQFVSAAIGGVRLWQKTRQKIDEGNKGGHGHGGAHGHGPAAPGGGPGGAHARGPVTVNGHHHRSDTVTSNGT